MSSIITVLLVDDHEVVRRGLADLLNAEPDMEVVGDFGTAAAAIAAIAPLRPDVAIVDVRLQESNGIDLCRAIRTATTNTAVLILTSFADDHALIAASEAGASAFVLKQIHGNDLLATVRSVASGELHLDAATVRLAQRRLRGGDHDLLDQLTHQERRVLDLIGLGRSNRSIAEELKLAEKTVKNYVTSVLMKLRMKSRTEAAVFAARLDERDRVRYE